MSRLGLRWLPAVLWMAFIFFMSTGVGNAEHSSRFIRPFLLWLLPHAAPETIGQLHFLIRKAGHFGEYAVLALLLLRGLGSADVRACALALLLAAAYAVTDEFHQRFVPGRTPSAGDVLIDATGAFAALATAATWRKWRPRRDSNTGPSV